MKSQNIKRTKDSLLTRSESKKQMAKAVISLNTHTQQSCVQHHNCTRLCFQCWVSLPDWSFGVECPQDQEETHSPNSAPWRAIRIQTVRNTHMAALLLLKSHVFHLFTLEEAEGAQARACMQRSEDNLGDQLFPSARWIPRIGSSCPYPVSHLISL